MPRVISIRDKQFVRRVLPENRRREHKTLTKTVQQLAEERLVEIQTGRFLPVSGLSAGRGAKQGEASPAS